MSDRILKLAFGAAVVLLVIVHWSFKPRPSADEIKRHSQAFTEPRDWANRLAPDFEMPLLDGSTFRLREAVGRQVVILNFFATWCGPCRQEMPELERYQIANRENGVVLIGVDAQEKATLVRQFVTDLELTFPIGIDDSGDVLERYQVTSFPTTVVIGADGRVKLREVGAIANAEIALDAVLAPEIAAVRGRKGITAERYLSALAEASKDQNRKPAPVDTRAGRIAAAMPCPCGCDDKVSACSCQTASGIKARLAQGGYENRTDAEVMEELNKEFCMKGM